MISFSDYIKAFKNENSPKGDLARDFIRSKSKATTYKGILRLLNRLDACSHALDALEDAYLDYKFLGESLYNETN